MYLCLYVFMFSGTTQCPKHEKQLADTQCPFPLSTTRCMRFKVTLGRQQEKTTRHTIRRHYAADTLAAHYKAQHTHAPQR